MRQMLRYSYEPSLYMLWNQLQPIPSVKASFLSSLLLFDSSLPHSLLPVQNTVLGHRTMTHVDCASVAWLYRIRCRFDKERAFGLEKAARKTSLM